MPEPYVSIPETITVHLGAPSENAQNITVPFADYIKNVASSEIYPTWPEQAIRANVYAQISYVLNRVFTEWYRAQGYDFDITNSTRYDQSFVPGRDIFENISTIVDDMIGTYLTRGDSIEPLFTQYCNGTTVTCPGGLSQWGTVPLAIHGVVAKKNGERIEICIGEKEDEPVFCITDLLPHLAAKQNERPLKDGLKGEELNVIMGSVPYEGEDIKEAVKLTVLSLLNEKYGIREKDFFRAEFELVPATKARDIGLDRSLIGAYGQDDRVCAYTALTAEIDTKKPVHTTVTILTDKEEIGSEGNTGLNSDYVLHYIEDLAEQEKYGGRGSILAGRRAWRGRYRRRRNHCQVCGSYGCGHSGSGSADSFHARSV